MNKAMLEYIKGLKPAPHQHGSVFLKEGIELGKTIERKKSRFIRESGYSNYLDYRKECREKGKITWNILMGLATLEEQIEGVKKLYEFTQRTGLTIDSIQNIASGLIALPKEYRDKAPKTTSFVFESYQDYEDHVEAAPIENTFMDYVLASPNALETTINSVKAGAHFIGVFSQIVWGYPVYDDDMTRFQNVLRALGIMASKRDEKLCVATYLEDGLSGNFIDCASFIGHALLEHYIVTTLCGARFIICFGGLLSEPDIRAAVTLALHRLLATEDQPAVHYINSSTTLQWDHDIHGNYGVSVPEMLFHILLEKKYKMGIGINPVSITEKLRVPILQELMDILAAGKRAEEIADQWLPFMDFSKIEEMCAVMMEQGRIFFENALKGFKEAGIDIEDPLDLILAIRKFDPLKFEQAFHPSTFDSDNKEIKPFFPTRLGRQTIDLKNEIVKEMKQEGLEGILEGKKIVVASADTHTYGLLLVEGVLSEMGATVINGGVDMDPVDMLDLADEENTKFVGISCHNGQALDYGRQIVKLAKERNKEYWIFMGGKLNAILPGHSEPTEIPHLLEELGINADNDIKQTAIKISKLSM